MPDTKNKDSCSCHGCQRACETKPGWFLPGEAEKAAALLNIPLQQFFNEYLGVDWWEDSLNPIFVLAPATTDMDTGEEYDSNPRGICIFYKDGLCTIHDAKPFECREFLHGDSRDTTYKRHQSVAAAWEENQKQISDLLGRKPESSESFSLLGWL